MNIKPRMKSVIFAVAFFAALLVVAASAGRHLPSEGTFGRNAYLYGLRSYPVDPTLVDIAISGNRRRGLIQMHIRNPNTTCVTHPAVTDPICGKRANDISLNLTNTKGVISLESYENIDTPQSLGFASGVNVTGTWDRNDNLDWKLDFFLQVNNKGPIVYAKVSSRNEYSGHYNKHSGAFEDGYTSLLSIAYLSGQADAYQTVNTFWPISSHVTNVVLPYHAYSPYNVTQTKPVAPYFVSGSARNVVVSRTGLLSATVSLETVSQSVNIIDGDLIGFSRPTGVENCFHITTGHVNDTATGKHYLIDNSGLCLH